MTIGEFIKKLDFNTVRYLHKKRDTQTIRIYNEGKNQYFQGPSNSGTEVLNLEDFEEKFQTNNFDALLSFTNYEKNPYLISPNHFDITSIIQFMQKDTIVGVINCNLFRFQFITNKGDQLRYDPGSIAFIRSWMKKEGFQFLPAFGGPFGIQLWKYYTYPTSFNYSPRLKFFETSIGLNLNSMNQKKWKINISAIGECPTNEQIELMDSFLSKKYDVKKKIIDHLFNLYQTTDRFNYELPELNDQEQLYYFLGNGGTLTLMKEHENAIIIEFATWDEEHGAYYYYFPEENRLQVG